MALISAGLGLSACQPAQKAAAPQTPTASQQSAAAPQPAPSTGGEQGEAGAVDAYAGITGAERAGLRLQQLKGFLLAAQGLAKTGNEDAARVLAQQGVLEALEPALNEVGDLDLIAVRRAGTAGQGPLAPQLTAALAAIEAAQKPLPAPGADRVRRMLALSRGLYAQVNSPQGVDPIEYQHSWGAALAAAQALDAAKPALQAKDGPRYDTARAEMARLVALWPGPVAPEKPAPLSDIAAAAARVELALSPF